MSHPFMLPDERPGAHEPRPRPDASQPTPLGRLIALIVSAGLTWAIGVAALAWILGQLVSRG